MVLFHIALHGIFILESSSSSICFLDFFFHLGADVSESAVLLKQDLKSIH